MNQWSRPTSTQIRPILQFSAKQSILSKSQRHPILRRKVAKGADRFEERSKSSDGKSAEEKQKG